MVFTVPFPGVGFMFRALLRQEVAAGEKDINKPKPKTFSPVRQEETQGENSIDRYERRQRDHTKPSEWRRIVTSPCHTHAQRDDERHCDRAGGDGTQIPRKTHDISSGRVVDDGVGEGERDGD
jgi:hypothetical protein